MTMDGRPGEATIEGFNSQSMAITRSISREKHLNSRVVRLKIDSVDRYRCSMANECQKISRLKFKHATRRSMT